MLLTLSVLQKVLDEQWILGQPLHYSRYEVLELKASAHRMTSSLL